MPRLRTALVLLALQATASLAAPAQPAPKAVNTEQAMAMFRSDLQSARAGVMAKNLALTAEQSAKFWPVFERYQAEQNAIIDAQIGATRRYYEAFNTLSDADAQAYFQALLESDGRMTELRRKWLAEFQKVIPTKEAVRAMQIDRRLSDVAQVKASTQIPLVR